MKYISARNGYVSMHGNRTGGSINLLNGASVEQPKAILPDNQQSTKNTIVGITFPHPPGMSNPPTSMLTKGGDLLNSLAKINFQKNSKTNKRKNIVFTV